MGWCRVEVGGSCSSTGAAACEEGEHQSIKMLLQSVMDSLVSPIVDMQPCSAFRVWELGRQLQLVEDTLVLVQMCLLLEHRPRRGSEKRRFNFLHLVFQVSLQRVVQTCMYLRLSIKPSSR